MGADAAVNAVYFNKLAGIDDPPPGRRRPAGCARTTTTTSTCCGWPSELVVDDVVEPGELRAELIQRFAAAAGKDRRFSRRRHGVTPV